MYSTCIGLILKGYNVYENNQNRLNPEEKRVVYRRPAAADAADTEQVVISAVPVGGRKTLGDFMNSIKDGLIDLFKEEGDRSL